jgi:hypothetical protein
MNALALSVLVLEESRLAKSCEVVNICNGRTDRAMHIRLLSSTCTEAQGVSKHIKELGRIVVAMMDAPRHRSHLGGISCGRPSWSWSVGLWAGGDERARDSGATDIGLVDV